ncbi:hypothetical protein ACQCVB_11005 [Fictibacillus phosphorivorans]|uniref:hypothetical protein n=1 Tax=Fictibacillus phosphorivorans TaxID=1221500 RepID=UPI003CEBE2A8
MNKITEVLLATIAGGLFTFFMGLLIPYFFDDSSIVNIGAPTKIDNGNYITPIQVSTFKDDIQELRFDIPVNITEEQINSNVPLSIKLAKNNVGTEGSSVLEFTKIPSRKNIQIIINTKQQLDERKIEVHSKNNHAKSDFLFEKESPLKAQLRSITINSILYALFFGLSSFLTLRTIEKRRQKANEEIEEMNKAIDKHKKEYKDNEEKWKKILDENDKANEKIAKGSRVIDQKLITLNEDLEKTKTDSLKKQILLTARLNDYRKELNFWRNTIRKILYKQTNGENSADNLFKLISKSLKTYQTNEKHIPDFEALKVLSEYIKDIDKEKE